MLQPGRARAPAWLTANERRAFDGLARQTEASGMPSAAFAHVLTPTAILWDQLRRDTEAIGGAAGSSYETTTTTGARKLVLRPEVANRTATLKLLRGFLESLGLTPASFSRLDRSDMPSRGDAGGIEEQFFGGRR